MLRLLAISLVIGIPTAAANAKERVTINRGEVSGVAVHADGVVGTWFAPINGKRSPTIIVLGGSEGGKKSASLVASALAKQGYGALALAYFRADGLPTTLENIPLEYFDRAMAWLARQPLADADRTGIYGVSIGAETALIVATRHPELKAIVVAVPSSVIWQGYNPTDYRTVESTYSLNGMGVPCLPYDTSLPFTGVFALYASSLKHLPDHPDAAIPVERINGAILLLSAKADTVWPSSEMSEQIMSRLDVARYQHPYRHVAFADAGHGAALPPGSGPDRESGYNNLGGTETGNTTARAGMWRETLAFFNQHLDRAKFPRTKAGK